MATTKHPVDSHYHARQHLSVAGVATSAGKRSCAGLLDLAITARALRQESYPPEQVSCEMARTGPWQHGNRPREPWTDDAQILLRALAKGLLTAAGRGRGKHRAQLVAFQNTDHDVPWIGDRC